MSETSEVKVTSGSLGVMKLKNDLHHDGNTNAAEVDKIRNK